MSSVRRIQRSVSRNLTRSATAVGVVGGLAGLTLTGPVAAAAAATAGEPQVVNQESVEVLLDAAGEVQEQRLYSQLTVLGDGTVTVLDPTSGKGVRDLDGFSAPLVRDGKAQYSIDVDGRADRRTVADFDRELPVTIKASYVLDGERVDPEDVVGRSGTLETTYTVVNRTSEPTEITYQNGKGEDVTETVDVVTPYVGRLALELPSSFKDVQAEGADDGGDGRGGTGLAWTLVLFEPIGEPAQQLTWTAEVTDAELPPATLQVVPVDPGGNRVLDNGQLSFGEGAAGAAALTKGAYKIDGKILEVRDGAAKIFEGLVKLSEGSRKLETGLVDSAAPGAQKLADGAGQLADGTGQLKDGTGQLAPGAKQLADGAGQLAAGAGQLKDGTGQLAPGARQLADGTGQLATGAGQLASGSIALAVGSGDLAAGAAELSEGIGLILQGVEMLPAALAADPGFQALKGALTQVQAGIGNPTDVSPTTLLGGINLIKYGLRSPLGVAGCDQTAAPGTPTACAIGDGLEIISGRQAAAAAPGGSLDLLIGAAKAAYVGSFLPDGTTPCPTDATVPVPPVVPPSLLPDGTVCDAVSNVVYGLGLPAGVLTSTDPGGVKAQTALSADKLKAMYQGIDAQIIPGLNGMALGLSNPGWDTNSNGKVDTGEKPGVKEVQGLVSGGLDQLVQGISDSLSGFLSAAHEGSVLVAGGAELVAGGTAQVAAGAGKLADGSSAVAAGAGKLSDGATKLDAGAGKLADGSTKVAAGAGKLSDGAAKLDVGAGKLDDGAGKLADGAGQLADGLQDAGDGSTQIADGVDQVKDGVGQLKDGANRLSGEGSSLLAGSANDAATSTARKAALLTAMAAKAEDGAMPYGLPDGAVGDAAFSYTLAGANSDAEESTLRGGAALALLALGSLSAFVVRRRVTA